MKRAKVAVVGLNVGRGHAQRFLASPEADLVALCDKDPALLKTRMQEFGVKRGYTDLDEMLAQPEIQAVSIAVPNGLHAPLAIRALEAGKHVLVEKPMTIGSAEAERMAAAAAKADRILMVHYNTRFTAESKFLKRMVDAGQLGDVYLARTVWHRQNGVPRREGFTSRKQAGMGALIDIGVHRLDLVLWLMGFPKPKSVTAQVRSLFGHEIHARGQAFDVDDNADAYVRFENGATLVFETSWRSYCEDREVMRTQLYGSKGGCVHQNKAGTYEMEARVYRMENGSVTETRPTILGDQAQSPQDHFAHCLVNGAQPIVTVEQALLVTRLLEAMHVSSERGCEVLWDDLYPGA